MRLARKRDETYNVISFTAAFARELRARERIGHDKLVYENAELIDSEANIDNQSCPHVEVVCKEQFWRDVRLKLVELHVIDVMFLNNLVHFRLLHIWQFHI